jgi:hypothetical protein
MVDSMLKKNDLLNKSYIEIENILGKADNLALLNENKNDKNIRYYVIHDTSWLVATRINYLVLYFDDKGYVSQYDIKDYEN